jgi:hypothetical protein
MQPLNEENENENENENSDMDSYINNDIGAVENSVSVSDTALNVMREYEMKYGKDKWKLDSTFTPDPPAGPPPCQLRFWVRLKDEWVSLGMYRWLIIGVIAIVCIGLILGSWLLAVIKRDTVIDYKILNTDPLTPSWMLSIKSAEVLFTLQWSMVYMDDEVFVYYSYESEWVVMWDRMGRWKRYSARRLTYSDRVVWQFSPGVGNAYNYSVVKCHQRDRFLDWLSPVNRFLINAADEWQLTGQPTWIYVPTDFFEPPSEHECESSVDPLSVSTYTLPAALDMGVIGQETDKCVKRQPRYSSSCRDAPPCVCMKAGEQMLSLPPLTHCFESGCNPTRIDALREHFRSRYCQFDYSFVIANFKYPCGTRSYCKSKFGWENCVDIVDVCTFTREGTSVMCNNPPLFSA